MQNGSLAREQQFVAQRGPRYVVTARVRRDEYVFTYALDLADAEATRDHWNDGPTFGDGSARVISPQGITYQHADTLREFGRRAKAAREELTDARQCLIAAARTAALNGMSDAEIRELVGAAELTGVNLRPWLAATR